MTNRQAAAKIVSDMLQEIRRHISDLSVPQVAGYAGKKHTSSKAADTTKALARQFVDPWVARMEKVASPRPKKSKADESVPQPKVEPQEEPEMMGS